MPKPAELEKLTGIASRFGAFVAERHPFALNEAIDVWEAITGGREPKGEAAIEALRPAFRRELARRFQARALPQGLPDTTPRTTAASIVADVMYAKSFPVIALEPDDFTVLRTGMRVSVDRSGLIKF